MDQNLSEISQQLHDGWLARLKGKIDLANKIMENIQKTWELSSNVEHFILHEQNINQSDMITYLSLSSSLARAKDLIHESTQTISFIENSYSHNQKDSSFFFIFEKATILYRNGLYIEALEKYTHALSMAPTPHFLISCQIGKLLVLENIGENADHYALQIESELRHLSEDLIFISIKEQLRSYWQRSLYTHGKVEQAQKLGINEDGSIWQNGYFSALMSEYPFTKTTDKRYLKNLLAYPGNKYIPNRNFKIRTLKGISSSKDLKASFFDNAGRLHLWFWKWMQNPDAFNFSHVMAHLKLINFNISENIHTTKNSHMLANLLLWPALWDPLNRTFLIKLSQKFRQDDISKYPLYDAEKKLIDYFLTPGTKNSEIEKTLKSFPELYFSSLLPHSKENLGSLQKLKDGLRDTLKEDEVVHNKIIVNTFYNTLKDAHQMIISSPMCLALERLKQQEIISLEEFSNYVFSYSHYDEFIHKPKVYNLLSRLKKVLPESCKIITKDNTIISSGLKETIIISGNHAKQFNLGQYLEWNEFILSLKKSEKIFSKEKGISRTSQEDILQKYQGQIISAKVLQDSFSLPKTSMLRKIKYMIKANQLKKLGEGRSTRYLVL